MDSRVRSCATSSRVKARSTTRVRCSSNPERSGSTGRASTGLGRLVERLSGKNLEEYFRERIFTPLGMPDTFYNVPEDKQPRLVTPHLRPRVRAHTPPTQLP